MLVLCLGFEVFIAHPHAFIQLWVNSLFVNCPAPGSSQGPGLAATATAHTGDIYITVERWRNREGTTAETQLSLLPEQC